MNTHVRKNVPACLDTRSRCLRTWVGRICRIAVVCERLLGTSVIRISGGGIPRALLNKISLLTTQTSGKITYQSTNNTHLIKYDWPPATGHHTTYPISFCFITSSPNYKICQSNYCLVFPLSGWVLVLWHRGYKLGHSWLRDNFTSGNRLGFVF